MEKREPEGSEVASLISGVKVTVVVEQFCKSERGMKLHPSLARLCVS